MTVGENKHSSRYTSEEVQDAFKVWMTHGKCNSHDVSHFAAFFIVVGSKTSVAESVGYFVFILRWNFEGSVSVKILSFLVYSDIKSDIFNYL